MNVDNLINAIRVYRARKGRWSHPDGKFDNAKRWWPHDNEHRACCDYIRTPSRSWPLSLNQHCRSIEHVAALYELDESVLRKAVRQVKDLSSEQSMRDVLQAHGFTGVRHG